MKKRSLIITIAAVIPMIVLLTACVPKAREQSAGTGGGNTLEGNIKVVGSTSVGPLMEGLKELFEASHPGVTIDVEQIGSGAGISAAMDGTADIGMSSRYLNEEESSLMEYLLCLDGIAVVTHPDNPVTGLTSGQLKRIYMGEITNWKDVGGNDGKITLITREASSGTRSAFEELVLGVDAAGGRLVIDETLCIVLNSMGNIGQSVESDKNSIGYMSLGITGEYRINTIKIDGEKATANNIRNSSYTLQRPFLLLTNGEPGGLTRVFLGYCLDNDEAKAYIREKRYILK